MKKSPTYAHRGPVACVPGPNTTTKKSIYVQGGGGGGGCGGVPTDWGLLKTKETPKIEMGDSGEREHGNNSVTCVRTGPDPPSRVGPGHMCDEPW